MGGMTIAGGIAGALFARERTGEPSVVDVSLFSVGAWATALSVDMSLLSGEPLAQRGRGDAAATRNPIVGEFKTKDGRYVRFSMLQPWRYWPIICRGLGREDLITDERFSSNELLLQNSAEANRLIREEMLSHTLAELTKMLNDIDAPWAAVQNSLEVGMDYQLRANGYVQPIVDYEGITRELVASPVQFDETPFTLTRAPQFAEHTDDLLREFGYAEDDIIKLKVAGAVT
jgi:crotonobetainyl-CoA:carnitine CoA-transferase CaiB-like acyl-CoA transferase